jgi:hypothetical protein
LFKGNAGGNLTLNPYLRQLLPRITTYHIVSMETPNPHPTQVDYMPFARKGVILTSSLDIPATLLSAKLVDMFNRSPEVGLNFSKIFDFEEGDSGEKEIKNDMRTALLVRVPAREGAEEREG